MSTLQTPIEQERPLATPRPWLVCGCYRAQWFKLAASGRTDFAVPITGRTGVFKSEIAALLQEHFGTLMDARHLPGSWASTGNSLEAIAFAAKRLVADGR